MADFVAGLKIARKCVRDMLNSRHQLGLAIEVCEGHVANRAQLATARKHVRRLMLKLATKVDETSKEVLR
jgi:hypothetical protein